MTDASLNSRVGRAVAAVRKQRKMSQRELALAMGISRQHLCHLEHGRRKWTMTLIDSAAFILKTSVGRLCR